MLLCADIGNTSIKFGVFQLSDNENTPICTFSLSSDISRSSDEYEFFIRQLLISKNISGEINKSVISSVVPSLTHTIKKSLRNLCNYDPFIIGQGTKTGFKIKIDSPIEFGADMVSNCAAAIHLCKAPLVIVDFGTATTITVIDEKQTVLGSIIMPGIKVSADALFGSAELLNGISLNNPKSLIGKNTQDSIRTGIINGNAFMIDGFIRNIRETVCTADAKLNLLATGGLSNVIVPNLRNKFTVIDDLTLIGAAKLYKINLSR